MIKIYLDCASCGFKGITQEDEDPDLTEDEINLMEEEDGEEECPMCGEFCKEIEDEDVIKQIEDKVQENISKRKEQKLVSPYSHGEAEDDAN